jgi:Tol biopolymer transport system component
MKKTISIILVLALGIGAEVSNADFSFGESTNLGPVVNSRFEDAGQSISVDGLTFYFSSNRTGGSGNYDLWVTTRASINDDWSEPENLGTVINTSYMETSPCLSADGLSLFFCDGVWHLYNPRPGGIGKCDIWIARRQTPDGPWQIPENLGSSINTSAHECDPSLSIDGLSLFFDSDRAGGCGSQDLWFTTRANVSDTWNTPTNLGSNVNSSAVDAFPSLSADGLTLFFMSDRTGDYDLWMTRRTSIGEPWGPAQNLGSAFNSNDVEACPTISFDGRVLYFMSMRPGGIGGMRDLWQVAIDPVVDLNGDAIVDAADMCIIVDNWHTDNLLCDIAPAPLGDGFVDVKDLVVLSEHLFEDYRMIAHWKLDEIDGDIAHDKAGNYHGDLNGDPIWQPAGGMHDGALEFDGNDDYVSTPFVLNPGEKSFGVFVWIQGGAPGQVIISQSNIAGARSAIPGCTWLGTNPSNGSLMTGLMDTVFGPLESDSIITDGQWHHIGLVYDLVTMRRHLYVDGAEVAVDTDFIGGVQTTGGLYIGAGQALDPSTFFSGLIDEVRIYNVALNSEEIAALAQ